MSKWRRGGLHQPPRSPASAQLGGHKLVAVTVMGEVLPGLQYRVLVAGDGEAGAAHGAAVEERRAQRRRARPVPRAVQVAVPARAAW